MPGQTVFTIDMRHPDDAVLEAHGLKSSAGVVGAAGLVRLASKLEADLRAGDWSNAQPQIEAVRREYLLVARSLPDYVAALEPA